MLQRLYVHNFRCLENFELVLKDLPSSLLIGKNGAGKSTIAFALEILQSIGRSINRVDQLIQTKDFNRGRSDVPIRFEVEVLLKNQLYKYVLALALSDNSREIRIFEEQLLVAGNPIYLREGAQLKLYSNNIQTQTPQGYRIAILSNQFPLTSQLMSEFQVDLHLVALPLIQVQSEDDPLYIFKNWLSRMIILAPIPSLMTGESSGETLEPKRDGSNFGEWFSGLLSRYPAAYAQADRYLREVMPDIEDFQNEKIGKDAKNMIVRFEANNAELSVDFKDLSDGEKCFFLCAVVLAANKYYSPFCFWDEPDNYLSLSEVGHFITTLRRSFKNSGQILVTSHNGEAISKFSNENTFFLDRKSHLEPTLIRLLSEIEIPIKDDIVKTLILGDIEL
ncbi:AAA family ATPase [Pseudanabaena sp. UWO310]|uniref:AAA family ATPase n=1 Tax=Pseudanabaena sp. UWO310 TaxID=2480795 RepID=UPI00115A676D|nr:AAA family ATPase [Pseudanabaena sp. UWO310]TYQ27721.1 AAA family ATPase [Pseudanabaena sp. UWO310]